MSREKCGYLPVEFTEYDDLGTLLAAARDRMDALEGADIPFEIIDLSVRGEVGIKTEHRQDNYVLSADGVKTYDHSNGRSLKRKRKLWGIGYTWEPWYDNDLPRIPSAPALPGATGETSHDGALHLYRFHAMPSDYVPDDPSPKNTATCSDLIALGFSCDDVRHCTEVGPIGRALAHGLPNVVELFVCVGPSRFVWSAPLTVR